MFQLYRMGPASASALLLMGTEGKEALTFPTLPRLVRSLIVLIFRNQQIKT